MMEKYREIFAREIAGSEVVAITDYLVQKEKNVATGEEKDIEIEKTDAVKFSILMNHGILYVQVEQNHYYA